MTVRLLSWPMLETMIAMEEMSAVTCIPLFIGIRKHCR